MQATPGGIIVSRQLLRWRRVWSRSHRHLSHTRPRPSVAGLRFLGPASFRSQGHSASHRAWYAYNALPRLEALIERGRRDALDVGWAITLAADAGFLEDGYRSLGEAIPGYPRKSLAAFAAARPTMPRACEFARMLPLSLVDNPEGRAAETQRRVAAVESVDDPALAAQGDCVLNALGASPDP